METLFEGVVFAAFLLAHVAALFANARLDRRLDLSDGQPVSAHRTWTCLAVAMFLFPSSAGSQDLDEVAHRFLRRHGVPCLYVVKVGVPVDLGEVATCEDGREWALFWIENEIAFIHPQTREAYKWDREIYLSFPQLYGQDAAPKAVQSMVSTSNTTSKAHSGKLPRLDGASH